MRYQSAVPGDDASSVQFMTGSPTVYVHSGGSRSWRRYNPGLLSHGLFALQHGAIGGMKGKAIFASEAEGDKALRDLLASEDFAYLTLEQAYKRFDIRYEPEPQPNPQNKQPPPPPIDPYTGRAATGKMRSLGSGDRETMAQAIKHELIGWAPGTITEETLDSGSLNKAKRSSNQNVLINGRTAVHAGSKGKLLTPDVCDTPTGDGCKPVLYQNVAKSEDADDTAATVKINGNQACMKSSVFKRSTGDKPGRCGGIQSGTIEEKAEFVTASADVTIEGEPAPRQFDLMVSNNRNTPPMPLMQPGGPPPSIVEAIDPEAVEATEPPDSPETAIPVTRPSQDPFVTGRHDDGSEEDQSS